MLGGAGGDALCSAVGVLSPWAIWIPAFFPFAKRTVKLGNHNIDTFSVQPSPGFSVIKVGREGPSAHHWESRVEGRALTYLALLKHETKGLSISLAHEGIH